jgi:hypothetical protein
MGFECALAVVLPSPATNLVDLYPSDREAAESDDMFFDNRIRVIVPARVWDVFKFINFGRVRAILKPSSSHTSEERAEGSSSHRAAKCTASFLLGKFFGCEELTAQGSTEFSVPFIADHLIYARGEFDLDAFNYGSRWKDIFEKLSSSDVVTGLWTPNDRLTELYKLPTVEMITQGVFWNYNRRLLRGNPFSAAVLEGGFQPPCGLFWNSASEVALWLTELLTDGDVEGYELRKDALSVAIVYTWIDTLCRLAPFGARVIILTGSFHFEVVKRIRSQYSTL